MINKILPNSICLLTMSEDELNEELSREIYNSANSHEMIRRLVKLGKELAEERDYAREKNMEYKDTINLIMSAIGDLDLR